MKIINLHGVVGWDIDSLEFAKVLDESTGDVLLDINSAGGYIYEGVSIMNKIKSYDRGTITARISFAASMMTQIALAADEVQVYNNSIFMIHNAQGIAAGDHNEMNKKYNLLKSLNNLLASTYSEKTKKNKNEILKMMDDETWLYGSNIIDQGFADTLIENDNEDQNINKEEFFAMANIELEKVKKAIANEDITEDKLVACGLINNNFKNKISCKKKEIKNMSLDIDKLRMEHSELYNECVQIGVNKERERVLAHIELGEASSDLNLAAENIKNGNEFTAMIQAKYLAASMRSKELQSRVVDNVENFETNAVTKTQDDVDLVLLQEALRGEM